MSEILSHINGFMFSIVLEIKGHIKIVKLRFFIKTIHVCSTKKGWTFNLRNFGVPSTAYNIPPYLKFCHYFMLRALRLYLGRGQYSLQK